MKEENAGQYPSLIPYCGPNQIMAACLFLTRKPGLELLSWSHIETLEIFYQFQLADNVSLNTKQCSYIPRIPNPTTTMP